MSQFLLRSLALGVLLAAPALAAAQDETTYGTAGAEGTLRVCADPNNLPFSNRKGEGFENKIAELIAKSWGQDVSYTWWPQRRGFVRETLRAKKCDVVIGVPENYDPVLGTIPYYRSTYVFVYPSDKGWDIRSLNDPQLKKLRIGVNVIGEDYANPPPVMAMAARGLLAPKGYSVYGDYSQESPARDIIDAIGRGEIDVAIVWGPVAGYFAKQQRVPLKIVPLPPSEQADLPFEYDITMGVRRSDKETKAKLDETIRAKQAEIRAILQEYGVPLVDKPSGPDLPPAEDDD